MRGAPRNEEERVFHHVGFLVNSRSGSNQGSWLISLLGNGNNNKDDDEEAVWVWDLAEGGPNPALECIITRGGRWLLAVAGGDGTVAWVMGALDGYRWGNGEGVMARPTLAVLPLGTGNDLARALGFGPGWSGGTRQEVLDLVCAGSIGKRPFTRRVRYHDRWRVYCAILDQQTMEPTASHHMTLNNYISFGCDAKVCHTFHTLRESVPSLFSSRLFNKMFYTAGGTMAFFEEHVSLERVVRLYVDGSLVTLPPDIYGLMILNIASYAGGADLWGKHEGGDGFERGEHLKPQRSDDGLIEVCGVSGTFNLGAAAVGLAQGTRIAQGAEIVLEFLEQHHIFFQVDGEPAPNALQTPAVIRIRLLDDDTTFIVPQ